MGAVIVGTGLPQVSYEREILKQFYDGKQENGFDYAYRFPGMNKVLQSAGRVIRRFMKNCGKGTILCGCYIPVLSAETVIYWNKRLWSFQNRMKRGSGSPRRSLKPVWISISIFCTRKCVQQTACCSVWEDVTGREEGFLNFPIFL